jgi:CheY-like chemotaxis protein
MPPLVLVVDDYEDARTLCSEYLQFRGFRVATAVDGQDAVNRALELHPDLILMDLSMPVLDGWEATRRIKQDGRTRTITVVALTAHGSEGGSTRALEAGCVAVLSKPIEPRKLETEVRRILDEKGRRGGDELAEKRDILDVVATKVAELRSAIVQETERLRPLQERRAGL